MGNCADCKHWDRGWALAGKSERRPCKLATLAYGVPRHAKSKAIAETPAHPGEGDHAWLYTTPDFGCVQFEPQTEGEGESE